MASFSPLTPGEPIGVVALSGPVDPTALEAGLAALRGWGRRVILAPNLLARSGYLAGDEGERLAGLERVLDDGGRVLLAARGGYGATRLLDRLPWERLAVGRATVVGFSDLTAVLNPLAARSGWGQVHGPMAAAGLARPGNATRLRALLEGGLVGRTLFRFPPPRSPVTAGPWGWRGGATCRSWSPSWAPPTSPRWTAACLLWRRWGSRPTGSTGC